MTKMLDILGVDEAEIYQLNIIAMLATEEDITNRARYLDEMNDWRFIKQDYKNDSEGWLTETEDEERRKIEVDGEDEAPSLSVGDFNYDSGVCYLYQSPLSGRTCERSHTRLGGLLGRLMGDENVIEFKGEVKLFAPIVFNRGGLDEQEEILTMNGNLRLVKEDARVGVAGQDKYILSNQTTDVVIYPKEVILKADREDPYISIDLIAHGLSAREARIYMPS